MGSDTVDLGRGTVEQLGIELSVVEREGDQVLTTVMVEDVVLGTPFEKGLEGALRELVVGGGHEQLAGAGKLLGDCETDRGPCDGLARSESSDVGVVGNAMIDYVGEESFLFRSETKNFPGVVRHGPTSRGA